MTVCSMYYIKDYIKALSIYLFESHIASSFAKSRKMIRLVIENEFGERTGSLQANSKKKLLICFQGLERNDKTAAALYLFSSAQIIFTRTSILK